MFKKMLNNEINAHKTLQTLFLMPKREIFWCKSFLKKFMFEIFETKISWESPINQTILTT